MLVVGAGRERHVDGGAASLPRPDLVSPTGEVRVLELRVGVQVDDEHGGVVVEYRLRAVAVVVVDIDDRDTAGAARLRMPGCDRDVVQEAEAAEVVAPRVVAGWPAESVCARFAPEHEIDGAERDVRRSAHGRGRARDDSRRGIEAPVAGGRDRVLRFAGRRTAAKQAVKGERGREERAGVAAAAPDVPGAVEPAQHRGVVHGQDGTIAMRGGRDDRMAAVE